MKSRGSPADMHLTRSPLPLRTGGHETGLPQKWIPSAGTGGESPEATHINRFTPLCSTLIGFAFGAIPLPPLRML
jgi:hypothetical protein